MKQGLRFVGYLERSPRNLTANRAIRTPGDVKGLKLRAPQAEVIVNADGSGQTRLTNNAATDTEPSFGVVGP